MRMEEGLDTGPVAARREEPIGDDDTAGTLARAAVAAWAPSCWSRPCPGSPRGEVALEAAGRRAGHAGAAARARSDGLLDFEQPARLVSAQARGVDPWPGPIATLDGEPLKLFRRQVRAPGRATAGEVLGLVPEGLLVACGEGAVAFAELQLPGRKRLPAAAVLAGRPIPAGTRLRDGIVAP